MSESRTAMIAGLRRVLLPELRRRGFRGSFPHFRRRHAAGVDLLTIQFSRWGGEFVVEVAHAPPAGVTMHWGEVIPPEKITAHDILDRLRLGSSGTQRDHWFKFDRLTEPGAFDRIAGDILPLLDSQAEPYWREA